jgi:hypothetical protein
MASEVYVAGIENMSSSNIYFKLELKTTIFKRFMPTLHPLSYRRNIFKRIFTLKMSQRTRSW